MTGRPAPCTSATTSARSEPARCSSPQGVRDHPADRRLPGDHRPRGRWRHPRQRAPAAAGLPGLGASTPNAPRSSPTARSPALNQLLAAVPEPGQRRGAAAQPDRQGGGREPPGSPRSTALMLTYPRTPGGRHLVLQGQRGAGRARTSCRTSSRRASSRGGFNERYGATFPEPGGPALGGDQRARHGRHQDEQVQGQRHRAADERRRDRQEDQGRARPTATGRSPTTPRPARGRQPAHARRDVRRTATRRSPTRSATADGGGVEGPGVPRP